MRLFLFIIISSLILIIPLQAQPYPDYKERSFTTWGDSVSPGFSQVTATSGNVDPDKYIIGPGDKIFVSISGLEEVKIALLVDQEGNIYIPKVGGIDLKKTNLTEAREKISNAVLRYYRNVDVFVTLVDFRKIKVSLLGNVNAPSTFVLSANSRLFDLITVSKGFTESSSFRNIKIISNDGDVEYYDLLRFLRFGDNTNNPFLKEGDIVLVDKVDKVIRIYGEIKYPGIYEFVENEKVSDLIELAGGFTLKARTDTIEVVTFDNQGKKHLSKYYSYSDIFENNIEVNVQDQVMVRQIPEYLIDRYVSIEGHVKYPGWYKIVKDSTALFDIINEAGGFRQDASLSEATVTRSVGIAQEDPEFERLKHIPRADMTDDEYDYLKAKSRERPGKIVIDFEKLFLNNDLSENLILRQNDVITVPETKKYITMLGQVVNPGKIIYKEGLSVDDYIELAGGFGWRALDGDVRVIKVNTGEWIEADDIETLDPGDTIWVPEDPPGPKFWDVFTTVMAVAGQLAAVIAATVAVIIATR